MIADKILNRLEKVRQTGKDSWLACCPAHNDRSPSLSIAEKDDAVLIHCFAGCEVTDVIGAVGLEITDLYPERPKIEGSRPIRQPFPARDVLQAISEDAFTVMVAAYAICNGHQITETTRDQLEKANYRIEAALRVTGFYER